MSVILFVVDIMMINFHPLRKLFKHAKRQEISDKLRNLLHFKDFSDKTGRLEVNIQSMKLPEIHLERESKFLFKVRARSKQKLSSYDFRTASEIANVLSSGEPPTWGKSTELSAVSINDTIDVKIRWSPPKSKKWFRLGYVEFKVRPFIKKGIKAGYDTESQTTKELPLKTRIASYWKTSLEGKKLVMANHELKAVHEHESFITLWIKFSVSRIGATVQYFREMGEEQTAISLETVDRDLIRISKRLDRLERGTGLRGGVNRKKAEMKKLRDENQGPLLRENSSDADEKYKGNAKRQLTKFVPSGRNEDIEMGEISRSNGRTESDINRVNRPQPRSDAEKPKTERSRERRRGRDLNEDLANPYTSTSESSSDAEGYKQTRAGKQLLSHFKRSSNKLLSRKVTAKAGRVAPSRDLPARLGVGGSLKRKNARRARPRPRQTVDKKAHERQTTRKPEEKTKRRVFGYYSEDEEENDGGGDGDNDDDTSYDENA
mmetsp:Transcript_20479/g.30647  ORF Transcript_20479/g.30647 Transcript_20479/m.30647 type:complete len:490 (+) Transcript_20479:282-1751(+)